MYYDLSELNKNGVGLPTVLTYPDKNPTHKWHTPTYTHTLGSGVE